MFFSGDAHSPSEMGLFDAQKRYCWTKWSLY